MKKDSIKTVLVITVGFLIAYIFTKWNGFLVIAISVGSAGALSTFLAEKIAYAWDKLAWVLSLIVPNILLGAIFYLFLFPIAMIRRIFHSKSELVLSNKQASFFKSVHKEYKSADFEKPW